MIKGNASATSAGTSAGFGLAAQIGRYGPGIAAVVTVACAAKFLEDAGAGPALIIALILGLCLSSILGTGAASPGVEFSAKQLLAVGVALLGARLTLGDVAALGLLPALVMVVAMAATLVTSWFCARALGLTDRVALIAGCGTAVCGSSAAIAASSVLPKEPGSEDDTALVIIALTVVSAVAMIVYPGIVTALRLPPVESGVILGGSIHNVPQAVAAGYSISDTAGNAATLTKLFRVALLGPIVVGIALAFGARSEGVASKVGVPWFILVFAALIILGSVIAIPPAVKHALNSASSWLLLVSIAAIGLKTSLQALRKVGPRVLVLILVNSAALIAILACAAFAGLL
jgi:uncharacterized integral membrane protein (TIGR00698 family)